MSLMPCNRRHDDHSSFYIIPDHRFCSFLTKKKTSLQVEMYQFMKLTHLILQKISKSCNPGIGDHIVNPSKFTICYIDHLIDYGRISRIPRNGNRSEEHTSELQSRGHLVCRLL